MNKKRALRRARTRRIANRRLQAVKILGGDVEEPESIGFFKKDNGFTNKKESTKQWEKTYKRKKSAIKDFRRNGTIIDHLD